MKKIIIFTAALLTTAALTAKTFSISDTFGGNTDTLEGQDLYSPDLFSLANRLQADADTKYFEGRARFDVSNINFNGTSPDLLFRGYAKAGFPYISAVFGNSFFSKFDIKAAEIFALDTLPDYGKIIKNGLGVYSEIPFNKNNKLKLGAAVELDSLFGSEPFALDFGFDYVFKNRFSIGGSFKDVTAGQFGKYSALAGFNLGDFRFNAGYIYNNTDTSVLPAEAKSSMHYAIEYKNKAAGIKTGVFVSYAMSPEYLKGNSKTVAAYGDNIIPFTAAFAFVYSFNSTDLDLGLRVKYSDMLMDYNCCHVIVYPNLNYKFCKNMLELNGGLKFDFNNNGGKNHVDFSLPVSLKFTWQTK